jgi:cellulose synthase (UDP-forming)
LATESLSGHIGQRIRWARGMIQILRTDNPLFAKGLKWPQRLCYFNAMIHFFYAAPRLIFLTSPLLYMLMGRINIPGHWAAILAYAMPHLFLANLANFRVQGKYRHSFWNEVYETVLAPYILGPTLLALINPKLGKFNVTAKGGLVKHGYFDRHIARPYVALIQCIGPGDRACSVLLLECGSSGDNCNERALDSLQYGDRWHRQRRCIRSAAIAQ